MQIRELRLPNEDGEEVSDDDPQGLVASDRELDGTGRGRWAVRVMPSVRISSS